MCATKKVRPAVQQLPDPKKYVEAQLPRAPPPDDGNAFLTVSNTILQLNTPEKKDSSFLHNGPQLQGDENEGGQRHEDEEHVSA